MAEKKREILPKIHQAIIALTSLSADAATLELHDNDQASQRLRREFSKFESEHYEPLKKFIINLRKEIITSKTKKPKPKNHESESETV